MKKLVVCALCAAMVIPAMSVSVSADSKELVLYTWENMFPQEVLDGFEEETGGTPAKRARLGSQREAGRAAQH